MKFENEGSSQIMQVCTCFFLSQRSIIILVVTSLFGLGLNYSVHADSYSLNQLLALSDQNPVTIEALSRIEESHARIEQARGAWADTMLSYNLMDVGLNSSIAPDMLTHKIMLSQEIPLSGRLGTAGDLARNNWETAKVSLVSVQRSQRLEILNLVSAYYWSLQSIRDRREEADFIKRLYDLAKTRYATGQVSLSILTELDIKWVQAQNMVSDLETANQNRLESLQELTGQRSANFELNLPDYPTSLTGVATQSATDLFQAYLNDNPERAIKQLDLHGRSIEKQMANLEFIPNLTLSAEINIKTVPAESTLAMGVGLNLSTLNISSKSSAVSAAESQRLQASAALSQIDNDSFHRLQTLVREFASLKNRLNLLADRALLRQQENISHMIQEYQSKTADLEQVFGAIQVSYELRSQYYNLFQQAYANLFEIEALSGIKNYQL